MRIAVNGLGRIGKTVVRTVLSTGREKDLVAINIGPADPAMIEYTLRYDSVLGTYQGPLRYDKGMLYAGDHGIQIIAELQADRLPWKKLGIDWVIDATGKFCTKEKAQLHKDAGAGAVLITAPMQDDDVTIIMGINEPSFEASRHTIVSLGSCTTNAVIPMLAMLEKTYAINSVSMTTTHAYTNSQALLDSVASAHDPRRSRAAALNIIPSTTGALSLAQRLIPSLAGKMVGHALRVPVATVSIIDLVVQLAEPVTREQLHELCKNTAQAMPGIMGTTNDFVVSSDLQGDTHSVIVDLTTTTACGNLVKLFGWYDNEVGYSNRVVDFLTYVQK